MRILIFMLAACAALAQQSNTAGRNPNYFRSCTATVTTNCNPRVDGSGNLELPGGLELPSGTVPSGAANLTTAGRMVVVSAAGVVTESSTHTTTTVPVGAASLTTAGRVMTVGAAGAVSESTQTFTAAMSGWSHGGSLPVWQKITKTYADAAFLSAASAVSIELGTLPASTVLHAIRIRPTVAFAGTGITAMSCSIGNGTTHDLFLAAYDVFQAVGNTVLQIDGGASEPTVASQTLTLRCTANTNVGDASTTVLTAGSLTVHVLTSTLVE